MAYWSISSAMNNAYINSVIFIILSTLFSPSVAKQVNFDACYENNVTTLDNTKPSDLTCFKYDPTNTTRTHTNQTFLSLKGCQTLCGIGFQYYAGYDIAFRLTLFVIPLVSLAGRVGIAPAGIGNKFWTIIHLLGDPIDSLWSTLARQEKARRNYHVGLQIAPGAGRDVAALWTAYDQWWQDPVTYFEDELKRRNPLRRHRLGNEPYQPNRAETWIGAIPPHYVEEERNIWTNVPDFLDDKEKYYIKKIVRRLAINRTNHPISSWIAILFFVIAMTGSYIHLATTHTTNDVSHALAVVTLFFFLLFAVYITGHVGNFRESGEVISAVFEVHRRLPRLFPPPHLLPENNYKGKQLALNASGPDTNLSETVFNAEYDKIQSYAGINSSWRPRKYLQHSRNDVSTRGRVRLFVQSIAPVLLSWLAAFLLSYMTPVWGLGCRSGSWTVITLAWIFSALFNFGLQWFLVDVLGKNGEKGHRILTKETAQTLWWTSMIKDLLITIGILILVGLSQVGYFNTCWCMASEFFRPANKPVCIDLGPLQPKDRDLDWIRWLVIPIGALVLIHAIIFWAGWEGEGGRLLYLRTKAELRAEKIALKNMKERLHIKDDSDGEELPRHSGQDFGHTSEALMASALQDSVPSKSRPSLRRNGYKSLPSQGRELGNLEPVIESFMSNPASAMPSPGLTPSPGSPLHLGMQTRSDSSIGPSGSEAYSTSSLLPHSTP